LGEGGMGEVFIAEHSMLGRRAAVKVLRPEYSHRPEIVARFFNEARAATQISDPGIVQIFDFGQAPDGSAYIVMELLEGETLDRRMIRQQVLPIPEALRLIRQVATSLATAHSRGIVHRDLKPENIFIVRDPEVAGGERTKILDFGIAKLFGDQGVKTQTSAVMGTPTYMSPEQCRGSGQVDHRADIYSLGCVLYLLVTGRFVFEAEGSGDLIAMHLRESPQPPSTKANWIPAALDRLILRCLAKNPAERFQTGTELASAISTLLETGTLPQASGPNHVAPTIALRQPSSSPPTTLSSATGSVSAKSMPPTKRRTGLVVGFFGMIVAGVVIAVVALQGGSNEPKSAAAKMTPEPTTKDEPTAAKVEPPKVEPPKVEPPKVEPPKVEPPVEAKTEPPKIEPPKTAEKTVHKDPKPQPRPKQPKQPKQTPGAYVDTDGDGIPDKR
jgi:eukaryotic-like serine/threonine-protein kinase